MNFKERAGLSILNRYKIGQKDEKKAVEIALDRAWTPEEAWNAGNQSGFSMAEAKVAARDMERRKTGEVTLVARL